MSRRQIVVRLGMLVVLLGLLLAFLPVVSFRLKGLSFWRDAATASGSAVERGNFILRVAVVGPLEPFSAAIGNSFMTAAQDLVFDTFLMPDEQGALMSRVLRRWERIDGRHYRVQLDPGLRFSDGASVSTQDAIASLAVQKLRGMVRGEWLEIEPLDPHVLVEPALLYTILHKQTETGPLGTGPYRLVSESQTGFILERIQPLPRRIRRVEIRPYPTPREVLARVIRGDTDAALNLDEKQLELVEGNPRLKPIRNFSPSYLTVYFNPQRLNATTRRQLAAVLPIRDIAAVFGEGCLAENSGRAPFQDQTLSPGRRLEVLVPHLMVSMDRVALAVRRALGRRGGEIVRVEVTEMIARWRTNAFDIAVGPSSPWADSILGAFWRTGAPLNDFQYSNPRVDAAFDRGDYAAAKAELAADVPYVPICRRERIGVVDSRIKNPRMGWWGLLDTLQDWEVEE